MSGHDHLPSDQLAIERYNCTTGGMEVAELGEYVAACDHFDAVRLLNEEIARLREYEFMYKGLEK